MTDMPTRASVSAGVAAAANTATPTGQTTIGPSATAAMSTPCAVEDIVDSGKHPTTGDWSFNWYGLVGKLVAFAFGVILIAVLLSVGYLNHVKAQLGPPPLHVADDVSKTVLDRNGQLLRAFTAQDGRWRLPVTVNDVDPRYLALLFAYEDRRFYEHHGVDVLAVARAGVQRLTNGRAISGASTLTMQAARLLDRRHERTVAGKVRQMARALQLETRLSKSGILDVYLKLAPFGGNIEGVRAATLAYFGKEPKRLSLGEAALLVALPQSPEARRPDRHSKRARAARDRVLDRGVAAGAISKAQAERAKSERVPTARTAFPLIAAHLSETEIAAKPDKHVHRLTLERGLQSSLEALVKNKARLLGDDITAAVLAVDAVSGEVLAHVGSADYLDAGRLGAIDMISAVRSPGSTLKPFIYGMAFEAGLGHPETLIVDKRTRFGAYAPRNFNSGYRGTVTLREALGASLNIPAVKLLDALQPQALITRLRQAGVSAALPDGAKPSLAVALGGVGLSLKDLTHLYVALARGGAPIALSHRIGNLAQRYASGAVAADQSRTSLLSPVAAWYVGDILKDAPAPKHFRAGRLAYKTGTSYGYRDAFAIGYDGKTVIAVWVGRADGSSVPGLVGRTAAAPILFDAFQRLGRKPAPLAAPPVGTLRVAGVDLPEPLKRFGRERVLTPAGPFADADVAIAFPPDRSELAVMDTGHGEGNGAVRLKAEGGVLPLTWLVDDHPIATSRHRRDVIWQPDETGFAKVSVIDAKGRVDRVHVRVR
ncbi:MAG: penicillin-binding protein 1C [Pseudomonadota bacterium]